MAYDEGKNKEFAAEMHMDGLHISLNSYDGGPAKLQIGPREIELKNGDKQYVKVGRLSLDEASWLAKTIPAMLNSLQRQEGKKGGKNKK